MKTTIYELLGMIRDNKAPKKIIYYGLDYYYDEKEKDYYHNLINIEWLFDSHVITDILNDEVEILETTITYTPNELKWGGKIKKIERCDEHDMTDYGEIYKPRFNEEILRRKINEIIDRLNKE